MISKISNPDFSNYLSDEKIIFSFNSFYSKRNEAQAYFLAEKVLFVASKNKNEDYDVMVHFFDISTINKSLQAIKKCLDHTNFLMYLRNEHKEVVYKSIDEKLIKQKVLWQILSPEIIIPIIQLSKQFKIVITEANKELATFYIDCFKEEFDENVNVWFEGFKEFKNQKEILLIKDNTNQKIASAVMYWVLETNIYIFLIGTKEEYRRLKLGQYLMQQVQEKHPNKEIQLTSYKDAKAYLFYKKLGFKDGIYSGLWF